MDGRREGVTVEGVVVVDSWMDHTRVGTLREEGRAPGVCGPNISVVLWSCDEEGPPTSWRPLSPLNHLLEQPQSGSSSGLRSDLNQSSPNSLWCSPGLSARSPICLIIQPLPLGNISLTHPLWMTPHSSSDLPLILLCGFLSL